MWFIVIVLLFLEVSVGFDRCMCFLSVGWIDMNEGKILFLGWMLRRFLKFRVVFFLGFGSLILEFIFFECVYD